MENNYTNYLEGWTHMWAQGETKGRGNDGRLCVVTGGGRGGMRSAKGQKIYTYNKCLN